MRITTKINIMEKRYQIFISSTFSDLKEERNKVMQTIMSLDCIPAGMELFPAMDEEQFEFIKRIIDDCDYYLLIVGARYGSMDENGVSYTEKEYDYAVSKGIPVIAFLHHDIDSLPMNKADLNTELRNKLESFRKKVETGRLVKFWKNADDLNAKVAISLPKTIKTFPRIGWVRANLQSNAESLQEMNVLRKELAELKAYKTRHEKKQGYAIDIATMDETFSLFVYEYEGFPDQVKDSDKQQEITHTWLEWFKMIATEIDRQKKTTKDIHTIVLTAISKNDHEDFSPYSHSITNLATMKYQFIAYGLIKEGEISYVNTWSLTSKGILLLSQLMSVKTKKKD